ncbi:alkylphosphonate utilization protein [Actibacterium sp. MT2.3-13A]|uniref:PhnA domain-containing protein n=1 Tax=Actibacterium sp. MT2.3-13A TaxID=2828332 RepID=UPI001BAD3805|nr:alkylphosphonate utilization protein [Actibacterium sp. MT2.3-13A]
MDEALRTRCGGACELCGGTEGLTAVAVPPRGDEVALCATCAEQAAGGAPDPQHLRCLQAAMWSEVPAVQVLAWRLLKRLPEEGWATEALEMLYLEPEILEWAEAGAPSDLVHRDSNGTVLEQGDTVVLIKDLPVKGAGFTAKRGTAVRGISLVPDNAEHIEGRVEGQRIVILTKFVKKR